VKKITIEDLLRQAGLQGDDTEELRRMLIRKQILAEMAAANRAKAEGGNNLKRVQDMTPEELKAEAKRRGLF
jgi:hypothetical protein